MRGGRPRLRGANPVPEWVDRTGVMRQRGDSRSDFWEIKSGAEWGAAGGSEG